MTYQDERLDRWLIASMVLHIAFFGILVLSPHIFPNFGANWGSQSGGANPGISVKIASNVSGVPLPTPEVVQQNAPANESPAFYKSEPAPPPLPDKTAEPVPQPKAPIKTTPVPKPKPPAPASKPAPAPEAPPNAVPAGQGGRPSLAYGQFSTGAGQAGIGFGDASFGDRYGWYVTQITRAISNNWLKSLVDSSVQRAPRVYVSFNIARDGTVNCGDVSIKQSSGIPSLDRSAQRAVCASSPLTPLPGDYRGGSVSVNFYFEYSR
ncbi:MAG TPA: TonB family protein [Terriglobia bacterium]|jgi:protein TonB